MAVASSTAGYERKVEEAAMAAGVVLVMGDGKLALSLQPEPPAVAISSTSSTATPVLMCTPVSAALSATPSTAATLVLTASPGEPPSPSSVLQSVPLTACNPLSSPDLSTNSIRTQGMPSIGTSTYVPDESLYRRAPNMIWTPFLSEFVLNCMVELVTQGHCFNRGFKEAHMTQVGNDLRDFTRIGVSDMQLYNHTRKWRTKWSLITRLQDLPWMKWHEAATCFMPAADEFTRQHLEENPKDCEFINMPIANYAQMKTIFTPRLVFKDDLYQPHLLMRALNYIADNEPECAKYRALKPWETKAWLWLWLRKQFA